MLVRGVHGCLRDCRAARHRQGSGEPLHRQRADQQPQQEQFDSALESARDGAVHVAEFSIDSENGSHCRPISTF